MADGSLAELKQLLAKHEETNGRFVLPEEQGEPAFSMLAIREIREDKREVDFICSTERLDSYGTVLEQDWAENGGKGLKRFLANPVLLYAHNGWDLPIGQARAVRVEGTGSDRRLVATVWFSDVHERAREVWALVKERTLRGISVGFKWNSYRFQKEGDKEFLILSDLELRELSITPCPSNPDCLAQLRARATQPQPNVHPHRTPAPRAPDPHTTPKAAERSAQAPSARKDKTMTEEEIKALQTRAAELSNKNVELEVASKRAAEERDAATARAKTAETQLATVTTERNEATGKLSIETKRADAAEAEINKLEVRALVGKKISPAEEAEFVELRSTNKPLFERMLAKKEDMPHERQVIPAKGDQTPTPPAGNSAQRDDDKDLAEFNASLPKD